MSNSILPVFRILLTKMTNLPYPIRVQTYTKPKINSQNPFLQKAS